MFEDNNNQIQNLLNQWTPRLFSFNEHLVSTHRNSQNRNIRQIIGHMVDSASNNTHRIIHLQYQGSPFNFPNYAIYGNNDKWISIQNYENEDWENLVNLWKYVHLHFIHVVKNVKQSKLNQKWIAGDNQLVSLQKMILDFPHHFELHLAEIEALILNQAGY